LQPRYRDRHRDCDCRTYLPLSQCLKRMNDANCLDRAAPRSPLLPARATSRMAMARVTTRLTSTITTTTTTRLLTAPARSLPPPGLPPASLLARCPSLRAQLASCPSPATAVSPVLPLASPAAAHSLTTSAAATSKRRLVRPDRDDSL
jgi:hypothetical protein